MLVNDNLISIVEDYISEKRNGQNLNKNTYTIRLKKLKKTEDQIHEIMMEIEDDCDRELLASSGVKNAKKGIIISVIVGLSLALVSILSALGYLFQGNLMVLFYGGIASAFFFGTKNYNEIVGVEHRRKRRELKWKNWN